MKRNAIPHCRLICHSSAQHAQQLYAGFGMLTEQNAIRTDIQKAPDYTGNPLGIPLLTVILNGSLRITYDAQDGPTISEYHLAKSDAYFKRSYSPELIRLHPDARKIFPLGFNYPVYSSHDFSAERLRWALGSKGFIPLLLRSSIVTSRAFRIPSGRAFCQVDDIEGSPLIDERPRILFVTRAWTPGGESSPPIDVHDRYEINDMRAECIRLLRCEFGDQFVGGFQPTDYALQAFPDCIIDNEQLTRKDNYLNLVRKSSICISTMGLQKSNPWKLGEYIAGAKGIVSEKIHYSVPGSYESGTHYLEFQNAYECAENVALLVDDPVRRLEMMVANSEYYQAYLRPDRLVWNTIQTALTRLCGERTNGSEQKRSVHTRA